MTTVFSADNVMPMLSTQCCVGVAAGKRCIFFLHIFVHVCTRRVARRIDPKTELFRWMIQAVGSEQSSPWAVKLSRTPETLPHKANTSESAKGTVPAYLLG